MWWRCRKYVANSGKTLFFCAKRAQTNETSNQDRSQSFLATPGISGGVFFYRKCFNQVLFATAPLKCKTSCPKVGSLHYCVLPYSNWDLGYFELFAISIGNYTVLVKVSDRMAVTPLLGKKFCTYEELDQRELEGITRGLFLRLSWCQEMIENSTSGLGSITRKKGHVSRENYNFFLR